MLLFFFYLLLRFFIFSIFSPLTFIILVCHFANYLLADIALSTASVRSLNNSSLILINSLLSFPYIFHISWHCFGHASLRFITFFLYLVFFFYVLSSFLPLICCWLFSYCHHPLLRSKLDLVVKAISSAGLWFALTRSWAISSLATACALAT